MSYKSTPGQTGDEWVETVLNVFPAIAIQMAGCQSPEEMEQVWLMTFGKAENVDWGKQLRKLKYAE